MSITVKEIPNLILSTIMWVGVLYIFVRIEINNRWKEKYMNDCPHYRSDTETCNVGFITKEKTVVKGDVCPYNAVSECPKFKREVRS